LCLDATPVLIAHGQIIRLGVWERDIGLFCLYKKKGKCIKEGAAWRNFFKEEKYL
jgi:hypothetical protein